MQLNLNESNLGDHGVRKYEYETGRFISIDPLWAKYIGWTPYQYSGNSPINIIDPNGKAWITDHIRMDQIAELRVNGLNAYKSALNSLSQILVESFGSKNKYAHLDDMSNSDMRSMLVTKSYKNWDNHQDQDFYFHSNYIEIMIADLGYKTGEIPLFEDLEVGSSVYNKVFEKLRTTEFPNENGGNINHDKQKNIRYTKNTWKKEGTFYAKDDNDHPFYEEAFRLGTEATVRNLEEQR